MKKVVTLIVLSAIFSFHCYAQESAQTGYNFTSFTSDKVKITDELESLTNVEFKAHPEYGVLPYNAPCKDCIELLQKRDETHRYFVKEGTKGRTYYMQSAYSSLNFYDKNKVLRTIDSRMKPSGRAGVFQAANQLFPVTINIPEKFTSILNAGRELQVNRNVSMHIKHSDGSVTSLGEPDWSNYTAGDNGVVVHNFYPGIDLELRAGGGNVECFYRMNKPLHLSDGWLVIHDDMKVPQGLVFDYSKSEKMDNNFYEGSLYFNDAKGEHCFLIGAPSASDENNQRDNTIPLNYQITANGAYDIYVPIAWMNDAKRSYPLVIDPLVTAISTLGPAGVNSSYDPTCFNGAGCSTVLNANVPAASIVTGISNTFWYYAFNPCFLSDGGWNITMGGCRFPTSGQETCPIGTAGRCQRDQDIFANFQSCLPSPTCNEVLPFTLHFFRCNQPAAACASSCISADVVSPQPWTITIEGRIMDLAPVVTTNPSSGSICAGSNITLTTTGSSGLPPYSYKWYPGSLTGSSVSVSPTANTTYTVTVSTCGGQDSVQSTVTVTLGNIIATSGPDTTVCETHPVQLHANGGTTYSWSPTLGLDNPNSQNPMATPPYTTTYTVTATSGTCVSTATVTVVVIPAGSNTPPLIYTSPDNNAFIITAGDSLSFDITAADALGNTVYLTGTSDLLNGSYDASLSPTDSSNSGMLTRSFTYVSSCDDAINSPFHLRFNARSGNNSSCSVAPDTTYDVLITVAPPSGDLLDTVPNIFTPNGDHKNDWLSLYHIDATTDTLFSESVKSTYCWSNFHIKIFNRWGELQFESSDIRFRWAGTNKSGNKVGEGVYYYVITADFLGKAVTKKGTVNVKL